MTDKAFIYRAYEDKTVADSTLLRDAVVNAVSNALRKKGKKFQKLWRKRATVADREVIRDNMAVIRQVEKAEGKGWIEQIYRASGRKPPRRTTNG